MQAKAGANSNHDGINVLVWNIVIWVGTVVPTLVFLESFNHDPKWKRWLHRARYADRIVSSFLLYTAENANMTDIEWDHTTAINHVKDLNRFGDLDCHCLDGLLENEICQQDLLKLTH